MPPLLFCVLMPTFCRWLYFAYTMKIPSVISSLHLPLTGYLVLLVVLPENLSRYTAIRSTVQIIGIAGKCIHHRIDLIAAAVAFICHFLHWSNHPPSVNSAGRHRGAGIPLSNQLHRHCDTEPGQHLAIS